MAHLIAGIIWIGTSFYFVWLDSAFKPVVPAAPGVDGELYMVHGSFFYRVEKRHFGAGEAPPVAKHSARRVASGGSKASGGWEAE